VLRKEEEETHFLQQNLSRREFDNFSQIKEYLSLLVTDYWQYRWENSQKGRTTYAFIPTVPESPRHSFTRESTQTLTGHGNFQVHLHRIGKSSVENSGSKRGLPENRTSRPPPQRCRPAGRPLNQSHQNEPPHRRLPPRHQPQHSRLPPSCVGGVDRRDTSATSAPGPSRFSAPVAEKKVSC
jgi:hypothetical protein